MTELDARLYTDKVHAVRHTFKPSPSLQQELTTFVGPTVEPRFSLHATRRMYVNSYDYMNERYAIEKREMREVVKQQENVSFVLGQVAMREWPDRSKEGLPPDTYQLRFMPAQTHTRAFHNLLASLDIYPEVEAVDELQRHYLTLDLPGRVVMALGDKEEREERFKALIANNVQKGLYFASVTGIGAIESKLPKK